MPTSDWLLLRRSRPHQSLQNRSRRATRDREALFSLVTLPLPPSGPPSASEPLTEQQVRRLFACLRTVVAPAMGDVGISVDHGIPICARTGVQRVPFLQRVPFVQRVMSPYPGA